MLKNSVDSSFFVLSAVETLGDVGKPSIAAVHLASRKVNMFVVEQHGPS
jgi:hypothetical protein